MSGSSCRSDEISLRVEEVLECCEIVHCGGLKWNEYQSGAGGSEQGEDNASQPYPRAFDPGMLRG